MANGQQRQDDRALYVISVAAELAGVHPQTLRIYERKGLVEPQRTIGRSRRYSDRDIRRLRRIQELTNAGVSLAGVKRIIALEEELDCARGEIDRLRSQIDALRREAERAVAQVHKQYRRDLVPLSKAVIRFGPR
ncbi:MAG TPA: MerR family transcriptional regulator [Acidimicrobiia bacterium]|nr:MerR family transcriptional regulator [Acidimicrobiia bacterium]